MRSHLFYVTLFVSVYSRVVAVSLFVFVFSLFVLMVSLCIVVLFGSVGYSVGYSM